jgi:hypothetical protein
LICAILVYNQNKAVHMADVNLIIVRLYYKNINTLNPCGCYIVTYRGFVRDC